MDCDDLSGIPNNENVSDKERDTAHQAFCDYEAGRYKESLKRLETLNGDDKSVQFNSSIVQFSIDGDVDRLLENLTSDDELDLAQQVCVDFNRALLLAKYKGNFKEAIKILEKRVSLITDPMGIVDERTTIRLCHLLAVIYVERKKDPSKALALLQFLGDKFDNPPHRLQQLKALCYLQMRSTKAAKKELKSINGEPLLRSYLELQRSNCKKTLKTFASCSKENPYYINNEAVINFCMGKKNTAVHLLSKQINNLPPETVYNYGLMNLFTGNLKNAFEAFKKCLLYFKKNPRLWLRIAECKLEELSRNKIEDFDIVKRKQDMILGYADDGLHRKMIFQGCNDKIIDKEKLLFIRKCLLHSLTLIQSDTERDFYPSNYPSEVELKRLTISILLELSYVNLCLHNFSYAHKYAVEALDLSPESNQKCLAHLYAGEALVWLDSITEAITHFSESTSNPPEEGTVYKAVLCYNLAVAYTLRGEFSKASETLRLLRNIQPQSNKQVLPIQFIVLAIYIQLAQGYVDSAKSIIKQHLTQYR